ncbi:acyl-CoA-binding protein [Mycotypha africana]|uniref:acyl-CoA-binding protein n=1 Tax=Mycotypha africana TaxID=64632 RepID=UPI002301B545|nr:acyl-CoA-binding protein [Mycotypha africana]KAI8967831.1 acyl-CoA-binding protein [Mycotypha africana]
MPSPAFEQAAAEVKNLSSKPSDDVLLKLYALFKQATVGDNNTSKPTFDLRGRAKWNAWEELKGKLPAEAEIEYINLVNELKAQHA